MRSLTLVSTWARPDVYYRRIQEMRKPVLLTIGVEPYVKPSSLWTAGPAQLRDMLAGLDASEAAQVEQAAPVEVMAARIDATVNPDRLGHLPRITAPTMVVVADDDTTLVPPYFGAAIAAAIPGASLAPTSLPFKAQRLPRTGEAYGSDVSSSMVAGSRHPQHQDWISLIQSPLVSGRRGR